MSRISKKTGTSPAQESVILQRNEKKNIKSRIQVLKSQQKDTEKSIKDLKRQLKKLSTPRKKTSVTTTDKKQNHQQ